jgi:hypothetical protein
MKFPRFCTGSTVGFSAQIIGRIVGAEGEVRCCWRLANVPAYG